MVTEPSEFRHVDDVAVRSPTISDTDLGCGRGRAE